MQKQKYKENKENEIDKLTEENNENQRKTKELSIELSELRDRIIKVTKW